MPELAKPTRSKKQVVSEFRQSEIITAARKVFAEKGYIDATVDEIAAVAALAKGTIYLYFESKEQIYNAVLANDLETLRRLTIEKIAAAGTALEKISAYINARFEYCEAAPGFFSNHVYRAFRIPGAQQSQSARMAARTSGHAHGSD